MLLRSLLILITVLVPACTRDPKRIEDQKLRLNLHSEPPSLDPRKFTDTTSGHVLIMLFEGLTRIDTDNKPKPAAAEKILISKDKCTYTFILRDSLWCNGERVTAEDFAYSWRKMLDPLFPSEFAYKLFVIKNAAEVKAGKLPMEALGLHAIDEKTLEITLNHPTPYFLELTAVPYCFPVNKKNDIEFPGWAAEAGPHYICNGPFCLKKWEHENEILVEKNPLYWDAKTVKLSSIELAMIEDTTTEFYMYEMGEIDWAGSPISSLPPEFLPALKEEGEVLFAPATAVYFYKINTDDKILSNKKIRLALGYCINRGEIVDHITQGGQRPALGLVPPLAGWRESRFFKDGDIEKGEQFFQEGLRELGLEKKDFPTLTLSYNTSRDHQKIAQAIQHQWKESLGIDIALETFDWKVYLSKMNKQDYQIGRLGLVGDFNDPVTFLEPYKFREGGINETGWEDPLFISYLDRAEKELDLKKRGELLRKAERLLIDDMPVIPLYYVTYAYLKKPYLQGALLSSLGFVDFKRAYLTK